jgi:hypothetical protein
MADSEVVWRYQDRVGDGCVCGYEWCCKCIVCFVNDGFYFTDGPANDRKTLRQWKSRHGW